MIEFDSLEKQSPGGIPGRRQKKGVLKNFAKLIGKHLFQGHFYNKVAGLSLQLYLKKDSGTGVFL